MIQGVTVRGEIRDLRTGLPIAAMIDISQVGPGMRTTSHQDGRFSMVHVPTATRVFLSVTAIAGGEGDLFPFTTPAKAGTLDLGTLRPTLGGNILEETRNNFPAGISAVWSSAGVATIQTVTNGSDADAAGLRVGDHILRIGDHDTKGLGSVGLRKLLDGPLDSSTTITVPQPPSGTRDVTLKRSKRSR